MRPKSARAGRTSWGFQSTHSLRSATKGGFNVPWEHVVSIHALLAECDHAKRFLASCGISFNPRTPCGVRQVCEGRFKVPGEFQSTHSLRSATRIRSQQRGQGTVSIHALLAECDEQPGTMRTLSKSFNPRTPCGVRRIIERGKPPDNEFQSTHSLRSATLCLFIKAVRWTVSIHALLAECDHLPVRRS